MLTVAQNRGKNKNGAYIAGCKPQAIGFLQGYC